MAKTKYRIEGEDATAAAFRSVLGNAQSTAKRLTGMFGAAFAGISVAGIASVAMRAIEMGDELNKAAIKAGISGKAISELAHAAKMADVDLDSLSTSLRFMQKNLSEATTGSKGQLETLKALGLELKDLKGLGADRQFELIADRISQMTDPADRARAATEMFGRAGANLLPLFEQGAAGIRAAREEAVKFGQSFDDAELKRLADADDAIKRLKASFNGLAMSITAANAGRLTNLLDGMDQLQKKAESGGFWEKLALLHPGNLIHQAFNPQKPAAASGAAARAATDAFYRGVAGAAGGVPGYKAAAGPDTSLPARQMIAGSQRAELAVQNSVAEMRDMVNQSLKEVGTNYEATTDLLIESTEEVTDKTGDMFEKMSVFADEAFRGMQSALKEFLIDPFDDGIKGMLSGFVNVLRDMAAEAASAKILGALSGAAKSGGGGILGNVLGALFGGFKAKGGPLDQGKWYIAGEKGPEPIWGGGAGAFAAGYGGGGGGGRTTTIAPVFNIDARGAQLGVDQQIRAAIAQAAPMIVDAARRGVRSDFSRGAYG